MRNMGWYILGFWMVSRFAFAAGVELTAASKQDALSAIRKDFVALKVPHAYTASATLASGDAVVANTQLEDFFVKARGLRGPLAVPSHYRVSPLNETDASGLKLALRLPKKPDAQAFAVSLAARLAAAGSPLRIHAVYSDNQNFGCQSVVLEQAAELLLLEVCFAK